MSSAKDKFNVGDKIVLIKRAQEAVIKYIGKPKFDPSKKLYGIELINKVKNGHNGTVDGVKYFSCDNGKGIFIEKKQIKYKIASPKKHTKRNTNAMINRKTPKIKRKKSEKKLGPRDVGRNAAYVGIKNKNAAKNKKKSKKSKKNPKNKKNKTIIDDKDKEKQKKIELTQKNLNKIDSYTVDNQQESDSDSFQSGHSGHSFIDYDITEPQEQIDANVDQQNVQYGQNTDDYVHVVYGNVNDNDNANVHVDTNVDMDVDVHVDVDVDVDIDTDENENENVDDNYLDNTSKHVKIPSAMMDALNLKFDDDNDNDDDDDDDNDNSDKEEDIDDEQDINTKDMQDNQGIDPDQYVNDKDLTDDLDDVIVNKTIKKKRPYSPRNDKHQNKEIDYGVIDDIIDGYGKVNKQTNVNNKIETNKTSNIVNIPDDDNGNQNQKDVSSNTMDNIELIEETKLSSSKNGKTETIPNDNVKSKSSSCCVIL